MHIRSRRPVTITPKGPRHLAPAWILERKRVRHVGRSEHLPQHGEDLRLRYGVGLILNNVGLGGDDSDEEDSRAGEEAGAWWSSQLVCCMHGSLDRDCERGFGGVGVGVERRGKGEGW